MITKGDWIVTKAGDTGHYAVQVEHDQFICELDPLPEAEDNAALIAAAPKLLAAAKELVYGRNYGMGSRALQLRFELLEDAIKEAKNK